MRHWILAILLCGAAIHAQTTTQGYVTNDGVALRAQPASYYERLAILKKWTPLEIVSFQGTNGNQWAEVRMPGEISGWIHDDNVNGEGVVIASPCPIYTGPGDHFTSFYMAKEGTLLKPEGRQDGSWMCVFAPKDATAWVSASFVALGTPPESDGDAEAVAIDPALHQEKKILQERGNRQRRELMAEQARLDELQKQSDELKSQTDARTQELDRLKNDAARLEAEREAAQAKAALAALEREKAQQLEAQELVKLEELQKAAQAKARLVQEDSERWAEEARRMADRLVQARLEAQKREEAAKAEAVAMEQEQLRAEELAREALAKAQEAQDARDRALKEQEELQAAILKIQDEVQAAATQADLLRLEREKMEASAREEQAKLDAAKAESERLSAEQREHAAKTELIRQENEKVQAELDELMAERKRLDEERAKLQELARAAAEENDAAEAARDALEEQIAETKVVEHGKPVFASASGIIVPLGSNALPETSHALCHVKDGRYVPDIYLGAARIDLRDWEGQSVTVSGMQESVKGWSRPLMKVSGIVLK